MCVLDFFDRTALDYGTHRGWMSRGSEGERTADSPGRWEGQWEMEIADFVGRSLTDDSSHYRHGWGRATRERIPPGGYPVSAD